MLLHMRVSGERRDRWPHPPCSPVAASSQRRTTTFVQATRQDPPPANIREQPAQVRHRCRPCRRRNFHRQRNSAKAPKDAHSKSPVQRHPPMPLHRIGCANMREALKRQNSLSAQTAQRRIWISCRGASWRQWVGWDSRSSWLECKSRPAN